MSAEKVTCITYILLLQCKMMQILIFVRITTVVMATENSELCITKCRSLKYRRAYLWLQYMISLYASSTVRIAKFRTNVFHNSKHSKITDYSRYIVLSNESTLIFSTFRNTVSRLSVDFKKF